MTATDIIAVIAAGVACLFLGLRAELLKPAVAKFHTAPIGVVLALAILSIAMAAAVISIWWGGGHATVREAWVYSGIAVSAVILFWNVHRQRVPERRGKTFTGVTGKWSLDLAGRVVDFHPIDRGWPTRSRGPGL